MKTVSGEYPAITSNDLERIMNITKSQIIIIGLVLLTLLVSAYFYPRMPQRMASHWNAKGQVDGYMSKGYVVFLMPVVMALIATLLMFIPKLDPLKASYEKFRKYYDGLVILLCIFLLCLQYFMLLWNIGIKLRLTVLVTIGIGLLFFYMGILCTHGKRNWFVGIRTPWTLSSDTVWDKTHKISGKLFKLAGVIVFAGLFFQKYMLLFILVPVFSITVFALLYSYLEYQKEKSL